CCLTMRYVVGSITVMALPSSLSTKPTTGGSERAAIAGACGTAHSASAAAVSAKRSKRNMPASFVNYIAIHQARLRMCLVVTRQRALAGCGLSREQHPHQQRDQHGPGF